MSKLNDIKESVYNKIFLFKQASTIGQVLYTTRELSKELYKLEKELKKLEI